MFAKSFFRVALAASLAIGATAFAQAAGGHSHAGANATKLEVKLNQGRKWASDDALRAGMGQIRQDMTASLPKIHKGAFKPTEFDALAGKVQAQVDHITANCKLPEDADLVLHGILEQVLDGIGAMKGAERRSAGAVKVVEALNVYGKTFEHPGWKPVGH
jgi:hypothetical protein